MVGVDEAVKVAKDPTGGRGLSGYIGGQLEAPRDAEEIVEAAV